MPIPAEDGGFSTLGLERARADAAARVQRGEIAGAVMLAARHGRVAQHSCVGLRDIATGLPMEHDTIFRIASMTKPIVSVGALMLVEAGKLRLDEPISHYVPEFADVSVYAGVANRQVKLERLVRPITVHHLLTHTSGLSSTAPHDGLSRAYDTLGDFRYELPELMRRIAARPLAHQPGDAWVYGASHDVLGRVIEVASGMRLDNFLASEIFAPLGMVDSGFFVPPEKLDRLAVAYESDTGGLREIDKVEMDEIKEPFPLLSGGGGCASTALDYHRFASMLLGQGELNGVRLLEPRTVKLMTRNHVAPPLYPIRIREVVSTGQGYGLGVGVSVDPSTTLHAGSKGTFDWDGYWGTHFWVDPAMDLIGVYLTQLRSPTFRSVGVEYRSMVYRALVN